jgi:hypothetical protein
MLYRVAVCKNCGATVLVELREFTELMAYSSTEEEKVHDLFDDSFDCCSRPHFIWAMLTEHLRISEMPEEIEDIKVDRFRVIFDQ